MPSILTILDWIAYGLIRYVLYLVPLLRAPRVDRHIPGSWWRYNNYPDWLHSTADSGHPDEHWSRSWLEMAFGELQRVATDKAKPYVDSVKAFLIRVIGPISRSFPSLGSWVNWLQQAVGYVVPHFATSLGAAAIWLYNRLPVSIRGGWQDWLQIWENIKSSVRTWARNRYDAFRTWTDWLRLWITTIGESIREWTARNAAFVDRFRENPAGIVLTILGAVWIWLLAFRERPVSFITDWLGNDWRRLAEFSRGPLTFYYNLWSGSWQTLSSFVADPLGFILDHVEQAVMDRW